jgi:hypothetical protein
MLRVAAFRSNSSLVDLDWIQAKVGSTIPLFWQHNAKPADLPTKSRADQVIE